jgi:hypothetical protein
LSYKLVFPFEESRIHPKIAEEIRKELNLDFGFVTSIPVLARFLKADGTWRTVETIFDTGAGISLLPRYVGEEIGIKKYVNHKLTGISKREECLVPVRISKVRTKLIDSKGNISPEFKIWVAFADRDDVPSVLGMKDIIDNFSFKSDAKQKTLYLEWIR